MPRAFLLFISLALPLAAQSPATEQGKIDPSGKFQPKGTTAESNEEKTPETRPDIKRLDAERLKISDIIVHRTERSITFPVSIAAREQMLEYLLVHEKGKAHESLLTTKVNPRDLHLAVLLLGANGQSPKIELTWRKNGPDARFLLTDLIETIDGTAPLSPGKWNYAGSAFDTRGFIAEREGSFITVLDDPSALIRHPEAVKLGKDDQFRAQKKRLPAEGTPISLVLTFPKNTP